MYKLGDMFYIRGEWALENSHRVMGLDPLVYPDSAVLILGTLPGSKSLEKGAYYADPTNNFWRILFLVCGETGEISIETKKALLEKYRIAIWDILQSAVRDTSDDKDIKEEVPNDLTQFIAKYPNIKLLLFHSNDTYKYFQRYFKNTTIPYIRVSSPSGQNRKSLKEKMLEWRAALSCVLPQIEVDYRLEQK